MANDIRRGEEGAGRDPLTNKLEGRSTIPNDLPDSPEREKLQGEETVIDLPDVKDIPGQEFVHAPPLGALADTTISSADEEGASVFDEEDNSGTDFNVSAEERQTLARTDFMPAEDENNLQRASMDNVDFQGDPLNEKGFGENDGDTVTDEDLDIDTDDETTTSSMGEGDEENKSWSLGSDDNDNTTEGTP